VDLELRPTADLSEADWTEVRECHRLAYGPGPLGRVRWAGRQEMRALVRARVDGVLASAVHTTTRWILVNERRTYAGGICGVMTRPEFRRMGLARTCMQQAMAHLRDHEQVEMALLLSSAIAVQLYAGLAWQPFQGPVWCEQPDGTRIDFTQVMPEETPMVWLLNGGAASGTLDMCGLPW
jgi:aminoglycoside 2'-N-acetyltransferase I